MPLQPGSQLGQYNVASLLGSGGMGEVYKARDTKLGRDVALKVLPDDLANDRERMARFGREAQVLASLNHPNIAAIYGVEESHGRFALVLEYVDGETLADRISRGPLPIDEVLRVAVQMAEALEAAHEKNVIHRDLKPANVKITSQGVVKVLDFGLAKAMGDDSPISSTLSDAPTLSAPVSGAGVILGTVGYMSPEQARGKTIDRRADIWSFGVILFEMLTARRLFKGETVTDTLAKVLERDPDWKQLPSHTPAAIRKLLQRCLTKNVRDRLQAIGDARTVLQEVAADPMALKEAPKISAPPRWRKLAPWVIAPLFLVAGLLLRNPNATEHVVMRFEYALPDNQNLVHNYRHGLDLSPDGKRMAFVAASLAPAGLPKLYVRNLDQFESVAVAGTEGARNPFFSPDGQWLGYVQNGQVKKVSLAGGSPAVVVEKVTDAVGLSWGAGGIVFSPDIVGPLKIAKETGTDPEDFTQLDSSAQEISHRLPHYLPDGSGVTFTVLRYAYAAIDWKRAQVWVKSLKTGERKLLVENALDGRVVGDYLVFARQGKLLAVRFDSKSLAVTGAPVTVIDGVTHATNGLGVARTSGAAQFSVAANGSLVYAPGSIEPTLASAMVWVDRMGKVSPFSTKPLSYGMARLSPDGFRVLMTEYDVEKILWLSDVRRGTLERETLDGLSIDGIWSPDGSRMVYRSNRSGPTRLYMQALNSPDATAITPGPLDYAGDWSPDGKEVLFEHADPTKRTPSYDIYAVSIDQPDKVRPVLNTPASETYPALSPDGRWLAYCSNKSGRFELYVQSYPTPGRAVLVSTDGASEPAWSRDGKELFFRNRNKMMSVRFSVTDSEFVSERPATMFEGEFQVTTPIRSYDVAPDGRFLMNQAISDAGERDRKTFPSTLRIVLNWTEELHKLLPSAR